MNTWEVIFEPIYTNYESEANVEDQIIEYEVIDLAVGIRRNLFINDDESRVFINANINFPFQLNSFLLPPNSFGFETDTAPNLSFGVGYNHNNKFSIEIRPEMARDVTTNSQFWESDLSRISFIAGYNILQ